MTHTPHELATEFPQHVGKLHDLKISNAHFAKLAEEYHTLIRQIHRIETDIEPASEHFLHELKKRRLTLLDEISELIAD